MATVNLTNDRDVYRDSTNSNTINGLKGNDNIFGDGGNDTIDGGEGNDILSGGIGNDSLFGGADIISSSPFGSDTFFRDTLAGNEGNDTLDGGKGEDSLSGGDGDDLLRGGADHDAFNNSFDRVFNDTLDGGAGNDTLEGGGGNDSLIGGLNEDILRGGSGSDTLDGGRGFDRLVGDSGSDTLIGGVHTDALIGGDGNDRLIGYGGEPTNTTNETDDLSGGAGSDIFELANSSRTYYLGESNPSPNLGFAKISDFASGDKLQLRRADSEAGLYRFAPSSGAGDATKNDTKIFIGNDLVAVVADFNLNVANIAQHATFV